MPLLFGCLFPSLEIVWFILGKVTDLLSALIRECAAPSGVPSLLCSISFSYSESSEIELFLYTLLVFIIDVLSLASPIFNPMGETSLDIFLATFFSLVAEVSFRRMDSGDELDGLLLLCSLILMWACLAYFGATTSWATFSIFFFISYSASFLFLSTATI